MVELNKEDLLDIKNCIVYHEMQHKQVFYELTPLDLRSIPSMYKSMAHYKRLLKKIKQLEKDLNGRTK